MEVKLTDEVKWSCRTLSHWDLGFCSIQWRKTPRLLDTYKSPKKSLTITVHPWNRWHHPHNQIPQILDLKFQKPGCVYLWASILGFVRAHSSGRHPVQINLLKRIEVLGNSSSLHLSSSLDSTSIMKVRWIKTKKNFKNHHQKSSSPFTSLPAWLDFPTQFTMNQIQMVTIVTFKPIIF